MSLTTYVKDKGPDQFSHLHSLIRAFHYKNTPIQIQCTLQILQPKKENFQIKNSDIFHIPAQNTDCGYSLEPPWWGSSNKNPQSMFLAK